MGLEEAGAFDVDSVDVEPVDMGTVSMIAIGFRSMQKGTMARSDVHRLTYVCYEPRGVANQQDVKRRPIPQPVADQCDQLSQMPCRRCSAMKDAGAFLLRPSAREETVGT